MKKILVTFIFVSSFLFSPALLNAQGPFGNYFGGQVIWNFFCNCSGNWLVQIGPPTGMQFVYRQGTQAYDSRNMPFVGICAVGQFVPGGGQCLVATPGGCVPVGAPIGAITSMTGSSPSACSPVGL